VSPKNKKFTSKKTINNKRLSPYWLVVLILALILGGWLIYRQVHASNTQTSTNGDSSAYSPYTAAKQNNTTSDSSTDSDKSASSTGDSSNSSSTSTPVKAPEGTFVSNHTPGQNGAPLKIDSICVTSVGAKCYIEFKQGSTAKRLAVKQTNSDGYANWSGWEPKDIGLTGGEWTITAVATNGSQTLSTKDTRTLVVQ
jgi:cytoskeletal protein RodZ